MSETEGAVHCRGCGRAYRAGPLRDGRALHCACGGRVGLRRVTGVRGAPGAPRFIADVMLAGLARWLRALGHDVAWEAQISDPELVARGVAEGRWVLTRDRKLAGDWWVDNLIVLAAGTPLEQLAELGAQLDLRPTRLFSRCLRCNLPLGELPAERRTELPPDVLARGGTAAECTSCRKLYWEGAHTRRMRAALDDVLRRDDGG